MVVCWRREDWLWMAEVTAGWQWPTETVTMPANAWKEYCVVCFLCFV